MLFELSFYVEGFYSGKIIIQIFIIESSQLFYKQINNNVGSETLILHNFKINLIKSSLLAHIFFFKEYSQYSHLSITM